MKKLYVIQLSLLSLFGISYSNDQHLNAQQDFDLLELQQSYAPNNPACAGLVQFEVIGSGLRNPQGFTVTKDGIYVAQCGLTLFPTPPPPGAPTNTGRISKILQNGQVQIIADNLPGAQGAEGAEQESIGVCSVAWLNGSLYALVDFASASGLFPPPISVTGVYEVNLSTGAFTLIADLYAFNTTHCSPQNPNCGVPGAFSSAFDMAAWQGKLYVSDGHFDLIDVIDPSLPLGSNIQKFADFSTVVPGEPHLVLTGLGVSPDNKYLYVVQLTPVVSDPQPPNSARVWKISQTGVITQAAQGYNYGQGVAVDIDGSIYVTQLAQQITDTEQYIGEGSLVRWSPKTKTFSTILPNLTLPCAVRIVGDYLYLTNYSQLGVFGDGQLCRINVTKYRNK